VVSEAHIGILEELEHPVDVGIALPGERIGWAEQVTAGCGGGNYCPNDPNIRGQMAVFLVKIFTLNLYGP
jgi:hypothetical protein